MKTDHCHNILLLIFSFLLFPGVISRPSPNSFSHEVISDGVDEINPIRMKVSMDEDIECEQMYGFLPCSKTIPGHLFLILVYQYLLFHAESYVDSGGKRVFKILGPGVFGASAFQIIGSLPEALILLGKA